MDDGSTSIEQSLEMAEMAMFADGVTHVVGTPHANAEYKFDPELIRQRRNELQEKLGDRLQLATGCDFHLSYENLQDIQTNTTKYTIHQKNYLLVEFADFAIPPGMDDALHHLQLLGISPIITHPERNRLIRSQPDRLRRWLHQGCTVQITAQSLLGRWGEGTKKQVEEWIDQEMVHFFASDAHNTEQRPLKLREAYTVSLPSAGGNRGRSRTSKRTRLRRSRDDLCPTNQTSPKSRTDRPNLPAASGSSFSDGSRQQAQGPLQVRLLTSARWQRW